MKNAALSGKPYAGNPHVRFDEGEVASAKPRRVSLLYKMRMLFLAFCSTLGALCVLGETVAYFPVDCDPVSGVMRMTSLSSSGGFELTSVQSGLSYQSVVGAALGTSSVLEEDSFVDLPCNRTAVYAGTDAGICYQSVGLGRSLSFSRDWTVEAWIFPDSDRPSSNVLYLLGSWNAGNDGFYFYRQSNGYVKIMAKQDGTTLLADTGFSNKTIALSALTNSWHHFAVSYECRADGNRCGAFTAYIDGKNIGTNVMTSAWNADGGTAADFYVGGCPKRTNFSSRGAVDMVRVCDRSLTANELLLANTFRRYLSRPASEGDIGYWRFEDGEVVNCVNASNRLTAINSPANIRMDHSPVREIPNPDPEDGLSPDIRTNRCALTYAGSDEKFYLWDERLTFSRNLYLDRDFTIEAYWKFDQLETALKYLYGIGGGDPRWYIGTNGDEGLFRIYCKGKSGVKYLDDVNFVSGGVATAPCWGDGKWHHYALVYKANVGNGQFELFIDAGSKGTVQLSEPHPVDGSAEFDKGLMVGGRGSSGHTHAAVDELRISRKALAASDFLCATRVDPVPSLSTHRTFAYWALDNKSGTAELKNAIDTNAALTATGVVSGDARQFSATVPRPDATPSFVGDRTSNFGSVSIGAESCMTAMAADAVDLTATFTLEGWVMTTGTTYPQTVVGTLSSGYGWELSLVGPCQIKLILSTGDAAATEKTFDLRTGADKAWCHLALVHTGSFFWTAGEWRVYADGVFLGSMAHHSAYPSDMKRSPSPLTFGSGSAGSQSVLFDTWRLSQGVLSSRDLLYRSGLILLFR